MNVVRLGAAVLTVALVGCGSSSSGNAGTGGVPGAGGTGGSGGVRSPTELVAPTETSYTTERGDVHTECRGRTTGVPVILMAGGTDRADTWDELRDALGDDALTCAFTRPGALPSYLLAEPYTPQLFADSLAEVLPQLGIGERFVFVAHSFGGLTLRVFGASSAAQIAGALFLDPTIPPDDDPVLVAEVERENIDAAAAAAQAHAASSWAAEAPVTVLSHDPEWALQSGLWTEAQQTAWDAGQLDYAALTDNGTQRNVPGAEHYIYRTNLEEVVQEIEALLP